MNISATIMQLSSVTKIWIKIITSLNSSGHIKYIVTQGQTLDKTSVVEPFQGHFFLPFRKFDPVFVP